MKTVLLVSSSPRGENSSSNQVAKSLIEAIVARDPGTKVITRNIAQDPPPHVDASFEAANSVEPSERTPDQLQALAYSDECIDEILTAHVVVIAAPMFNFSIPSSLKAWIDNIVRIGRTLQFSSKGPVGMLQEKHFILVLSSGGVYSTGNMKALDFMEPYLRAVLGILGVSRIDTLRAEGISVSAIGLENAIASARAGISQLIPQIA